MVRCGYMGKLFFFGFLNARTSRPEKRGLAHSAAKKQIWVLSFSASRFDPDVMYPSFLLSKAIFSGRFVLELNIGLIGNAFSHHANKLIDFYKN